MTKKLTFGVFILLIALAGSFIGSTSAQDGPTGFDASTTIVISQAYGGGGGTSGTYSADYVELKNISSTPQSLNGLSIMYGSASGQFGSTAGNVQALPDVTLQPGQYFLIQLGTVGSGGAAVPNPDFTNTTTNMAAGSGKVALVTSAFAANTCGATATPCALPNANIIDLVSWGAANNAEGGAPTNGGAALTSTQGNVRKSAGCTDTDNNNADFDIVTNPVPRNTSTAAAPCSGAPAQTPAYRLFKSYLNGAKEVPPNASTAGGFGRVSLNAAEDQITVSVYYNRLSSGTISGHIHGPAPAGTNAGIIFDLMPTTGQTTGSVINRTFNVTPAQVADLRAGLWYFNIHTTNFPGGEIRGQILRPDSPSDFNGDSRTDLSIVRPGGGQLTWWTRHTQVNTVTINTFGSDQDFIVPADFDGDGKTDIAIWRPSSNIGAGFWVLKSSTGTAEFSQFGQAGDDPWVVDDYTGDGVDDFAIYRQGAGSNDQSFFWYIASSGPFVGREVAVGFGTGQDFAVPGDYNGNGIADFTVVRGLTSPTRSIVYTLTNNNDGSGGEVLVRQFGVPTDFFVPGDYDGDGITDLAVARASGSTNRWIYRPSGGGDDVYWIAWGNPNTDIEVPGDYNGDGITDIAIFRTTTGEFIARLSGGGVLWEKWGQSGDVPSIWAVK